uniref:Dimer_Tnp_hAT domain-containing protein n=1 Tax=Steinernema glaseri TaxID=37863 RepID=A0A1I7Z3F7_9BILA
MDAVPWLFVESVCLCLDRQSLRESCKILSWWGNVSFATSKKIHTLRVFVGEHEGKLYAAARSTVDDDVPLESVDLKFTTNFSIEPHEWVEQLSSSIWKETTLDQLQMLINLIRPTTERRHPTRYDPESSSTLRLDNSTWITKKLYSMRLPVDSVELSIETKKHQSAAEEFLDSTGPLYDITFWYTYSSLKKSTVDALINKFVPVDGGFFSLGSQTRLTRDQLERLVLKCRALSCEFGVRNHDQKKTSAGRSTPSMVIYESSSS